MSEKRTIAVVKPVTSFPKKDGTGDISVYSYVFSDGDEGQTFSKPLAEFLNGKQGQELELNLSDGKEWRGTMQYKITGAQGFTAPARSGGFSGGRSFVPRDHIAEESAKHPAFAMAYAKDLVVSGKVNIVHLNSVADEMFAQMQRQIQSVKRPASAPHDVAGQTNGPPGVSPAPKVTVPVQGSPEAVPAANGEGTVFSDPEPSPEQPSEQPSTITGNHADWGNLTLRPLMIKLRKDIRYADPQGNHWTQDLLDNLSHAELEELFKSLTELKAAQ